MAAPTKPYVISVKLSGGTAAVGYVHFTNGRTGDVFHCKTNSSYEVNCNLAKIDQFSNGYQNGDVIDITATGSRTGNTTHTVNTGTGSRDRTFKLTCTDVSTTNAPAVSIG